MVDLTTIAGTSDLWNDGAFLAHMPLVTGRRALAQRLARRLTTPRGKCSFWPNFGTDMRAYLLSKAPISRIVAAARLECIKDEQVEDVFVAASVSAGGAQLDLTITVTDSTGTWTFTLTIDQAAKTLIQLQGA